MKSLHAVVRGVRFPANNEKQLEEISLALDALPPHSSAELVADDGRYGAHGLVLQYSRHNAPGYWTKRQVLGGWGDGRFWYEATVLPWVPLASVSDAELAGQAGAVVIVHTAGIRPGVYSGPHPDVRACDAAEGAKARYAAWRARYPAKHRHAKSWAQSFHASAWAVTP